MKQMDLLSLETEKSPPEPIEVPEPEPHVYSVSEINKDIRQILGRTARGIIILA